MHPTPPHPHRRLQPHFLPPPLHPYSACALLPAALCCLCRDSRRDVVAAAAVWHWQDETNKMCVSYAINSGCMMLLHATSSQLQLADWGSQGAAGGRGIASFLQLRSGTLSDRLAACAACVSPLRVHASSSPPRPPPRPPPRRLDGLPPRCAAADDQTSLKSATLLETCLLYMRPTVAAAVALPHPARAHTVLRRAGGNSHCRTGTCAKDQKR